MAAVSLPTGYPYAAPPSAPERPRTRWWLVGIVVVWALVIAGFAVWSVRKDPPTVPEQRDIAEALPVLQRTTGVLFSVADGPDRVLVLGDVEFDRDCALTPVRAGVEATRDVTVHVRADQAPATLDDIAGKLPAGWAAAVRETSNGNRHVMRADAGEFVGVQATADLNATVFTLRASTGCRPLAEGVDLDPADQPGAGLEAVLKAIGAPVGSPATRSEVACPAGGKTASTVVADGLPVPGDIGRAVQPLVAGAVVVQADPHTWAFRSGDQGVVVSDRDGEARASITSGCN
jgi:hypothetical protein